MESIKIESFRHYWIFLIGMKNQEKTQSYSEKNIKAQSRNNIIYTGPKHNILNNYFFPKRLEQFLNENR